jgi:putative transposase
MPYSARLWPTASTDTAGVTILVQREGFAVGAKKVRRVTQEDNLLAVRRRKFVVTTDSEHGFEVHPNLAEHLVLSDVNQLWVADITYLRLQSEFVYLAVVLDAFSRRAVGWALGRNLLTSLPLAALEKATHSRRPQPGLVHHSDRGTQYASNDYVQRLEGIGAVTSELSVRASPRIRGSHTGARDAGKALPRSSWRARVRVRRR